MTVKAEHETFWNRIARVLTTANEFTRTHGTVLWSIAIVGAVIWLLGLATNHTLEGVINLAIVPAVVMALFGTIKP